MVKSGLPALTDQRGGVTVELAERLQVAGAVVLSPTQCHPDFEGLHLLSARREVLSTDKLEEWG